MPAIKHKVVFSVTNCICHDQRVRKMAEVVCELGANVTIVGRKRGECCSKNTIPFKTRRFRMLFKRGFLFYKFYNLRLLFYLLFHKSDLLVSNDLDTLLPNYLVSKIKRIPLVYDSHEYFTGVPELQNRPLVKWVWRSIERAILPRLKNILTVSDSIADLYFKEYGVSSLTVRNCSLSSEMIPGFSREEMGVAPGKILLIFQGAGINIQRGGEELISAMARYENAALFIIGGGDVIEDLKKKVSLDDLSGRVRFFPKMAWEEMMRYTRSADAGLSLDRNTNINYRFSLPNKLFDYISAGIPVIAGDLPEVSGIIADHSCGIIIPDISSGEIVQAIRLLDENRDLLKILKQNAKEASVELSWEKESAKVLELYLNILGRNN